MRIRIATWWDALRSSYWFVPSLMVAGAFTLAIGAIWVDRNYTIVQAPLLGWLEASAGAVGVRDLLNAVAGGMITIAGVTFSITIVALSLASQQFGPRLLYNFMRDRGNQFTLGTFVSTFIYALILLRATDDEHFVPSLSATIAVLLTIVAIGVLVYFFHHVSASLQADNVVAAVALDLDATINRICDSGSRMSAGAGCEVGPADVPMERDVKEVTGHKGGYIQAVDEQTLMELAIRHDLVIRVRKRAGHFASKHEVIAEFWPPRDIGKKDFAALADAFMYGTQRTHVQDLEFGMDQLVEVAVRSLSPGINDPFTARMCIDRIGEALAKLARSGTPLPGRRDDNGRVRIITHPPDFRGIVDAAFDQLRQNVWPHVAVAIRMLEAIERAGRFTQSPAQRDALRRQAQMLMRAGHDNVPEPEDRRDMQHRYEEALRTLEA
jgi:uncharacterized membrane protein